MNGIKYILDTNIVIYRVQGNDIKLPRMKGKFAISFITELELLSYWDLSEKENERIHSFLNESIIVGYDYSIKNKAIDIRKETRIKLPDALIAAAAKVNNATLITADLELENKLKNVIPVKLLQLS